MSSATTSGAPTVRRERPHLLPSNRKVRNLVSISLRNLFLTSTPSSPSSTRRRTKTIDDDGLPSNLISPAKAFALREQRNLEHSRSSSDLRTLNEDAVTDSAEANGSPKGKSKTRPALVKMRRRSTLEWVNASPQRRQERLEKATVERMGDVFFTLSVGGLKEPVYVSEVINGTMNPTFRQVDWEGCGPGIMRCEELVLRFWARRKKEGAWTVLIETAINMRDLMFLGKSLETMPQPLPPNAILLHLTDGIYTPSLAFPHIPQAPSATAISRASTMRTLPTSSFDALLRLAKLDDSIQDALATRNQLASSLETLVEDNKEALADRDRVPEAEDRLKTIEYAKRTVEKQVEKGRKQAEERRASLALRRRLMKEDGEATRRQLEATRTSRPQEIPALNFSREETKRQITAQRRRVCEDLQTILPIQPIPGQNLAFTVLDLRLPNSDDLDAEPPDKVAAALGYTAELMQLLSFNLAQPLLYPVHPRGSTSTITDPISLLKTSASTTLKYTDETALRTYPLFSKGVPRFRFEYGVFLLNKNIQILLESAFGVRVLDVRQTLPNLKYLLYVATAGEGELPARKAGGVRGLAKREGPGRTGSSDSTASGWSGMLWHSGGVGVGGKEGKAGGGAIESLKRSIVGGAKGKR